MPADYDKIAPFYDLLSGLVFGTSIKRAQRKLLYCIPTGDVRLLIAGGGTGWILEEITKVRKSGLVIDYVDASANMISISMKRNYGANVVNFIHAPIEDFRSEQTYDVILTPFFFDNFGERKGNFIFDHLDAMLSTHGTWLFADFRESTAANSRWQKLLLRLMYLFFRITTQIETNELIDTAKYFEPGYRKKMQAYYYFNFIQVIVYVRKHKKFIYSGS